MNNSGVSYKEFGNGCSPEDISFMPPSIDCSVGAAAAGSTMATAPATAATAPLPPPQIVIVQAPKMQRSFARYPDKWSWICGAVQIGVGVASIILGIANATTCAIYGPLGYGLWCGVLFIISGSFGIVSSKKKTSCTIITHMVMSIISATAAAAQFSLAVAAGSYDMDYLSPSSVDYYGCYYNVGQYQPGDDITPDGAVATDALLAVIAIVEGVVAIIGSAVSCKVICCSSNFVPAAQGSTVNGYPSIPPPGAGQVMQGQVVYFVSQPSAAVPGQSLQQFPVAHGPGAGYGY